MLKRLKKTFLAQKWGVLIVDESHNLRTTKNKTETDEKETLRECILKTKRVILLSGTPSLTRYISVDKTFVFVKEFVSRLETSSKSRGPILSRTPSLTR
jgi:SNF2 family DNA or RNA helicase